jgi:hypothetical protein
MMIENINSYLQQSYDLLILVHPDTQVLERISNEIQDLGVAHLNISQELSAALLSVPAYDRGRFSQKWMMDLPDTYNHGPVLCIHPDLIFEPSFKIDPLALFRQAARVIQLIVLWTGEYSQDILSYAIPEHHHFRTWKVSDSLLRQPMVKIQRISASQGV